MNRNAILAAAVALLVGIWSGLVLAQVGAGPRPLMPFAGVEGDGAARSADAPRAGVPTASGMAFMRLRLDNAGAAPRACLEFSRPVSIDPAINLSDFIRLEPAAAFTTEVSDTLLCLAGLPYETDSKVTILEGLPAQDGEVTRSEETFQLSFGDRPAYVGFVGSGVILPRNEADGVAFETVNVSELEVQVLRVNDRILSQRVVETGATIAEGSWDYYDFTGAGQDVGVEVYKGRIPVDAGNRRNETITTVFALGAALRRIQPGAYIVKVRDASPEVNVEGENADSRPAAAYRWILYTDMALQTFRGATGLDVVARSLTSARPMSNVTLTLVAENNDELARSRTDSQGRVRFNQAVMDGEGPQRARYVMAYGREGDFAALDLDRAALDLTDRGVDGRRTPGDIDAYLYTDRGVYRPGERVRVTGLLRDGAGRAITTRPSTLIVYRPNGTEAMRQRLLPAEQAGAVARNVMIARGAPRGVWRVDLAVDGQEANAGTVSFSVEDFVPQRLRVALTGQPGPLLSGGAQALAIDAQFLYGAPGASLAVDAEARLQVEVNPFDQFPDYRFGRADESFNEQIIQIASTVTDAAGKAELVLSAAEVPQTSLPLRARVVATVSDPGGRPVRESLSVPVRTTGIYLGVRPSFENDAVPENGSPQFQVIAVNPQGQAGAARGVRWTLVEEDWSYDWYLDGGEWRWRRTGRDIPVDGGEVSITPGQPATIGANRLRGGSYRLVLRHEQSGAETSYQFGVGWGGAESDRDTPDMVTVAPPTDPVRPGGRARVEIRPPYAGQAQIVIATDRVHDIRTINVPAGGTSIDVPVSAAWGGGAYVLVTVMTARDPANLPVPRRAVGVGYISVDTAARELQVSVGQDLARVRPRGPMLVPVNVTNIPRGETAYVAIAAVDEGILQITKYESPNPIEWFFARRALGVELRDDYGRLLNPNLGAPAQARSGGDSLGGEGLTIVPQRTVALISDVVPVRNGRAEINLAMPDFNGEVRLMAVAWSASAVGALAQPVTVRDPVVAELSLPRFLAPGDQAQAALTLDNLEGPEGRYTVRFAGQGAAAFNQATVSFTLNRDAQARALVPLAASTTGLSNLSLTLDGPSGFAPITRTFDIETRAPYMPMAIATVAQQGPGMSYTLPRDVLEQFLQGQGNAVVSYSNLRGIDPAPLLDSLSRYPYGCSEQLTSVATPLLYMGELAAQIGARDARGVRQRLQETATQLLDRQGTDGAFGLWRANDNAASPWLGAYVTDFLQRAKAAGIVVPDEPMTQAYRALQTVARPDSYAASGYDMSVYQWPGNTDTQALLRSRAAAYALYVLAKAGQADIAALRYMHDARLRNEPSPLARAHIAAALQRMGDTARARSAFRMAEEALGYRNPGDWYQTPVRDVAAVLALAAEAGQTELVDRLAQRLERDAPDPISMSTQEQAQVLLAAHALLARGQVNVSLNGQAGAGQRVVANAARIAEGLTFRNDGQGNIWRTLTVSGAPRQAPPATSQGFALFKSIYSFTGGSVDLNAVRQGDRLVIVVGGEPEAARTHPALVADLLPAGLEIETVLGPEDGLGTPQWDGSRRSGPFAFVGELSTGRVTEARDDRFIAAIDVTGSPFRFAYIARAVTPGTFAMPGANVEDMYRPGVFARTSTGRMRILPREG